MRRLSVFVCVGLLSCTPAGLEEDAGVPPDPPSDAGVMTDAGQPADAGVDAGDAGQDAGADVDAGDDAGADAGNGDAGSADAGSGDAGASVPLAGFGALSGDCGPLALPDLVAPTPSTFETRIDFAMLTFDAGLLSDGGYRMYTTPNAGGSSVASEAFAYEVLHRCELAELAATETEVTYTPTTSKKTDLVVWLEGELIGVSVVRAFKYPPGAPLTVVDATALLQGKFSDILVSSQNIDPPWRWRKQILHVLAYDDVARQAVLDAAISIDASVRADTILYITVTDGDDAFIY